MAVTGDIRSLANNKQRMATAAGEHGLGVLVAHVGVHVTGLTGTVRELTSRDPTPVDETLRRAVAAFHRSPAPAGAPDPGGES